MKPLLGYGVGVTPLVSDTLGGFSVAPGEEGGDVGGDDGGGGSGLSSSARSKD